MRRACAILLLPVLLFAGTSSSFSVFRCRYDQVARHACCCPTHSETVASEPSRTGIIAKTCCCEVETVRAVERAPSEASRLSVNDVPVNLLAVLLPTERVGVAPSVTRLPRRERPPSVGPPIILLTRSLQI